MLKKISEGKVKLAFRKWIRPTVKTGGTLVTAIGVLRIDELQQVNLNNVPADDIRSAGFKDRLSLEDELQKKRDGHLYRIRFHLESDDPRIALRNQDRLSDQGMENLKNRLARMDSHSKSGPWTKRVLTLIDKSPGKKAADLATELKLEKDRLKINIRKLKNLGLTVSLETGYKISPRGKALLSKMVHG